MHYKLSFESIRTEI